MNALLGIIFHALGGGASGSWYMPYNWVKKWRWEVYWITGGLFSWFIMPLIAVLLTIPGWQGILHATPGGIIRNTYIMGLLWGVTAGYYFDSWFAGIANFAEHPRDC
jgi:L-rhamnose-H+ transport protein